MALRFRNSKVIWSAFRLREHKSLTPSSRSASDRSRQVKLLFAGRMVFEKGGDILIRATTQVASLLSRPVLLDLVGEGPDRLAWRKLADNVMRQNSSVKIIFHPWLESAELAAAFDGADLLVVPSVWPEPFGLTGPEAGLHSLPSAAFAIGGIPEWLHEGVNGHLAGAHPCTSDNLAAAIAESLRGRIPTTPTSASGAHKVASQFNGHPRLPPTQEILSPGD